MHLKVEQSNSNRFVFSLENGENTLFRSDDPVLPFLGKYGTYLTFHDALVASTLFAYRNFPVLTRLADMEDVLDSDGIKSRLVAKFSRGLDVFLDMLENMKNTREKGSLKQRIQNLKQAIDQYAKAILETAKLFEDDARVKDVPEDVHIQDISFEELKSPYSKDLLALKGKLHQFYRDLKENFGEFLPAVASGDMYKIVTAGDIPWYKDILVEFGSNIASALPLKEVQFSTVKESDNGYDLDFKTPSGLLTVSFGRDLTLTGIHPHEELIGQFSPMSQSYYNSLWLPVFKEVGNFRINENFVAIPKRANRGKKIGYENDGSYLKDSFVAFDLRDGSETTVEVFLHGRECCGSRTCSFVLASDKNREENIRQVLDQDMQTLMNAKMVRCIGTGTKYDGMAGEVKHKSIVKRETYIEIPVVFRFDDGREETVILTSDQVEKYA